MPQASTPRSGRPQIAAAAALCSLPEAKPRRPRLPPASTTRHACTAGQTHARTGTAQPSLPVPVWTCFSWLCYCHFYLLSVTIHLCWLLACSCCDALHLCAACTAACEFVTADCHLLCACIYNVLSIHVVTYMSWFTFRFRPVSLLFVPTFIRFRETNPDIPVPFPLSVPVKKYSNGNRRRIFPAIFNPTHSWL